MIKGFRCVSFICVTNVRQAKPNEFYVLAVQEPAYGKRRSVVMDQKAYTL